MSARVYVDVPNIIADNIKELYAVVEMKDGMRVVSGGDIKVWAVGRTAKWIKSEAVIDSHIFCSNCLTRCKNDIPTKYCSHCGFLMDNGGEKMKNDDKIIHCKDCKYRDYWGDCTKWSKELDAHKTYLLDKNMFCGLAERK